MKRSLTRLFIFLLVSLSAISATATSLLYVESTLDCDKWIVGGVVQLSSSLPPTTVITYSITASQGPDTLYIQNGVASLQSASYGSPFLIVEPWGDAAYYFDGLIDVVINLFIADPLHGDMDEWVYQTFECIGSLPNGSESWSSIKSLYR